MGETSLPKACRIVRTNEYRAIYRTGRRVRSANFILFHLPSSGRESRIGLAVGRKVGGAVVRNKVRRRMREIIRRLRPLVRPPSKIALVAHPGVAALDYTQMEREMTSLLQRAGLLD